MTDQGALYLLLLAFVLVLQLMAGKALGLFWLAWRQEVRWNQAAEAFHDLMMAEFRRSVGIEAGRDK